LTSYFIKSEVGTASAFVYGMRSQGNPFRVFDCNKAARIIRERSLEGTLKEARAGLQCDWECTGGAIFRDGSPVPSEETCTYLASAWDIPELFLDGGTLECWSWEEDTPGWNEGTYWPEEALSILNSVEEQQ
jgi:hypothetical protein